MPEFELFAFTAGDVLPLCLVALLSFALGMIATILFVMARSGPGPHGSETAYFEDEEEEEEEEEDSANGSLEAAGDQPSEAPPKEIWEKDPDWWKK